jgi:hypothetical protein
MFTDDDLKQIEKKGIDLKTIEKQLHHFSTGFPFITLSRAATAGDGILSFTEEESGQFILYFESAVRNHSVIKFVPASGAASRMFKLLFEFREKVRRSPDALIEYYKENGLQSIQGFFLGMNRFAFYPEWKELIQSEGHSLPGTPEEILVPAITLLLERSGLDYSNLPKALLKFHMYPEGARIAAEEHLVEAAHYSLGKSGKAEVHFTLSEEHVDKFYERINPILKRYEERFAIKFGISHSIQKPSTDTLAVEENDMPFRNPDGSLLFRPAGHGALLENLQDLDADIIFIKNIDNIVPDRLREDTYKYKKIIGGYLLWVTGMINNFLRKAVSDSVSEEETDQMERFAADKLLLNLPDHFSGLDKKARTGLLADLLNRPVRICGMVRNEGEPGGGPYWVAESAGNVSLQIVESAQVDFTNPDQKNIFNSATHFNPVDLVCSTRDFRGNKFRLDKFRDDDTGLISKKSSGGKVLKAQELPGLWNGSMAKWITLFVEVPIITFNPVKTVNDLLRNEHQPER